MSRAQPQQTKTTRPKSPPRSSTVRSFGPSHSNGPLEAAWGLVSLARAAELLKRGGARSWTPAVEKRFLGFVDGLLMPNLRYFDAVSGWWDRLLACWC
jgi:hypothetical protein